MPEIRSKRNINDCHLVLIIFLVLSMHQVYALRNPSAVAGKFTAAEVDKGQWTTVQTYSQVNYNSTES